MSLISVLVKILLRSMNENVDGPVDAETSGGKIEVENAGSSVIAKTSGGSIEVESAKGAVRARTSGGSIEVGIIGQPDTSSELRTS